MITSNSSAFSTNTVSRSLQQMNDSKGEVLPCFATENLWVGYAQRFADPASKNEVTALTTGKAYFAEFIKACSEAKSEIYITGWQVNWDALLEPGVRLFDVLLAAAKRGCKIYVMPWDDTAPVQTYDDETKVVLERINAIVGKTLVEVRLANAQADKSNAFFSNHQKQVVIDRKVAFVGGIDLAYGRYDDATYSLRANGDGREAMNRYNGCVQLAGQIPPNTVVNPALLKQMPVRDEDGEIIRDSAREAATQILNGAWQVPLDGYRVYGTPNFETLDAQTQPRMPWQDVQLKITGPAVAELTRNFVYRWNALVSAKARLVVPPVPPFAGTGGGHIQVLRSAPAALRTAEYKALPTAAQKNKPNGAQDDIYRAMQILIDKAQHFIYIENQFFVSAFGTDASSGNDADDGSTNLSGPAQIVTMKDGSGAGYTTWMPGDSTQPPQNDLCQLIAGRIGRAIMDAAKPNFHVYITLPVYSEGRLDSGAVITQIHWTMQTLVFGSMSLLNRIRRFIKARELHDKKDADWGRVLREGNDEFIDVPMKDCFKYVTLLNLRNWEKLGDRYVTEQIYVHSKMMIVDDRFAIVGSANINDRSLLGSRDSELAVLMMDTEIEKADLCGDGKLRPTRSFVRKLRKDVWSKIFGIKGGVRPATELQAAIDKPADPKSWKKIQEVAEKNTALYEAAFDWIPRNSSVDAAGKKHTSSIWPTWDSEALNPDGSRGAKVKPMPFDPEFWAKPQHNLQAANLNQVKGYITLLPIDWTKNENNNIGYHTWLVTENKKSGPHNPPTRLGQGPTEKGRA